MQMESVAQQSQHGALDGVARALGVAPSAAQLVNELYGAEFRLLFPIPQREVDANPALVQNTRRRDGQAALSALGKSGFTAPVWLTSASASRRASRPAAGSLLKLT